MALAVPPVERSSTPCPTRKVASSRRPVLSETERRARLTFHRSAWVPSTAVICEKEGMEGRKG